MKSDLNKIFKPTKPVNGDELTSYLNKKSDADLTRKVESALTDDDFLNDAFEGLQAAQEHNVDFGAVSFALTSKAPIQKKSDYRFFWAAAASILIVFSIALFLSLNNNKLVQQNMAMSESNQTPTPTLQEEANNAEITEPTNAAVHEPQADEAPKETAANEGDKIKQSFYDKNIASEDLKTVTTTFESNEGKDKKTLSDAVDQTIVTAGTSSTGLSGGTFSQTQSMPAQTQSYDIVAANKAGESLADDNENANTKYEYKAKEELAKKSSVTTKGKSKSQDESKNQKAAADQAAYRAEEKKLEAPSKELAYSENQNNVDSKSNRNNTTKQDAAKDGDASGKEREQTTTKVTTTSPATTSNTIAATGATVNTETAKNNGTNDFDPKPDKKIYKQQLEKASYEAEWNQASGLEKQGKTKELKKLLKKIAKSKSKYAKSAQQKLDKLP